MVREAHLGADGKTEIGVLKVRHSSTSAWNFLDLFRVLHSYSFMFFLTVTASLLLASHKTATGNNFLQDFTRVFCNYSSSETGRIRFRRVRFQTPSSVSFLALTEFWGESSVSSSQPTICVLRRTHRVFRRTHRVCRKTQ